MEQKIVLELFDRYADTVYRIALSYLRSPQEAEDVVQTIFLKLLEGSVSVIKGKERAFLTKVTINHCKNLLSAAKRHETVPLDGAVLEAVFTRHPTPPGRIFFRRTALIFLEIHKVFLRQIALSGEKISRPFGIVCL